jgi:hypothetical protein
LWRVDGTTLRYFPQSLGNNRAVFLNVLASAVLIVWSNASMAPASNLEIWRTNMSKKRIACRRGRGILTSRGAADVPIVPGSGGPVHSGSGIVAETGSGATSGPTVARRHASATAAHGLRRSLMRGGRSKLRPGARPHFLDGLGDVRRLASGVAVRRGPRPVSGRQLKRAR